MALFVKKCPCLRPKIEEDVRVLDYRHCSLTDIPGEVFNFERTLEELYVDSNQIGDLPRVSTVKLLNEPPHDKTNRMTCAPSKDSDQPGHPPSLIRVFTVCMKKAWDLSYPLSAQQRLIRPGGCPGWSESSLGAQSFCWFCHEVAQISGLLKMAVIILKFEQCVSTIE